jgi:hypothetical protein
MKAGDKHEKYEYRIEDKSEYFPPTHPTVAQIKAHNYICVKGEGNPNGEGFWSGR